MTDRLAYRVPEVCKMLGISRATFYRRVTTGELCIKKLGGVSLVTRESLERWVGVRRERDPLKHIFVNMASDDG